MINRLLAAVAIAILAATAGVVGYDLYLEETGQLTISDHLVEWLGYTPPAWIFAAGYAVGAVVTFVPGFVIGHLLWGYRPPGGHHGSH